MLRISCRHGHRKGKQLARERDASSCQYQGERFCRDISDGKHEGVDRNEYLTEIRLAIRRRGIINPAWRTTSSCTSTTAERLLIFI